MTSEEKRDGGLAQITAGLPAVTRSAVPDGLKYAEYREYLREDFFYSCAYCTISEFEGHGIGFAIDHYEPQKAKPELENKYNNLMYSCNVCNQRKSDISPPDVARANGFRFFRPDQDVFHEHFERRERRLERKSNVGEFSIDALDLNRQALMRIRRVRERIGRCAPLIAEGVRGLRGFRIDQLPPRARAMALRAIRSAQSSAEKFEEDIDVLLNGFARSPLLDADKDAVAKEKARLAKLKGFEALFPGAWRARAIEKRGRR